MPRPRFTLRVALATTAVVAWFAWQGGIVWQRRTVIHDSPHKFVLDRLTPVAPGSDQLRVNPVRELWGDEPVRLIFLIPENDWKDEVERMKRLFPEAKIQVIHPQNEVPGVY